MQQDFVHNIRGQKLYRPFSEPQLRDPGIGTVAAGRNKAALFLWRSEAIRDTLERLRTGRGPKWELPANVSDEYKRQLAAEQKLEKRNQTTGKCEQKWTRRHGTTMPTILKRCRLSLPAWRESCGRSRVLELRRNDRSLRNQH